MSDNIVLNESKFNNLNVYSHPSLDIIAAHNGSTALLLLGFILDPLHPDQNNDDIVKDIADKCTTKEILFRRIQHLSGRFVLLYKNEIDFIVMGDTCNLRNLYYSFIDNNVILTSSPKMFMDLYGKELVMSALKQEFINMKEYIESERNWFSDESFDDRLNKVLPNHYLDITTKKVVRTPIFQDELISQKDTLEYTAIILKGSLKALYRRFKVLLQPITAGTDTRTLLAASKELKDNIQYYSFDTSTLKDRPPDSWVPQRLSARLGICFQLIRPGALREDFQKKYIKEHIFPRNLPQLNQIQYHYYHYSDCKAVRICGFGGEIGRIRVGYTTRTIDANMIRYLFGYGGKSKFVNIAIDKWLEDAFSYCKEYNLSLLDMFYWEQQMGNWGSQYPFEQDIAIEEYCPWYNKNMLFSIMQSDPKKRGMFKSKFHYDLISNLWPEVLKEPINPVGLAGTLAGYAGRNTMFRYYKIKMKSIIHPKNS